MAAHLYTDDGLLASPWTVRLQEALDILTCLLDRLGMRINVENTVDMVCQPFRTAVIQL